MSPPFSRLTLLLLISGVILYLAVPVWFGFSTKHDNDLRHIYLGMQALYAGDSPYPPEALFRQLERLRMGDMKLNPYVYLPFTGLALGFLKSLPLKAASNAWFLINHVLMLASLCLLAVGYSRRSKSMPSATGSLPVLLVFSLLLIVAVLNHPFLRTLTAGQLNIVLLFCLVAAFYLIQSGRDVAAGAVLAFAAMFKIAPFIFIFYFIFTRRIRALISFVLVVAALSTVSIFAVGLRVHLDFMPMLSQMSYGRSTWEEHRATFWKDPYNQSLNSFFTHAVVRGNGVTAPWMDLTQRHANAATWAASLVLLGGYLLAGLTVFRNMIAASSNDTVNKRGQECPRHDAALFQATTCLMLLLPSLMWDHYLILLLPAVTWLIFEFVPLRSYAGLLLIAAAWMIISMPWNPAAAGRSDWGIIIMSLKLWPALLIYMLNVWSTAFRRNAV